VNMSRNKRLYCFFAVAVLCLSVSAFAQDPYVKTPVGEMVGTSPPDANKPCFGCDASCWLATAANMLAGAGYGNGTTVQNRANEIYNQLKLKFTTAG